MPRWKQQTLKERFYSKVAVASENECWLWLAGHHGRGYGLFHAGKDIPENKRKGRAVFAHKVALYIEDGVWSDLCVLHSCDNPACVNPRHLSRGTHQDNMRDMKTKERYSVKAKLTLEQVIQIINAPKYIQTKWLAETYNIDASQVSRVRNRKIPHWEKLLANKG